MAFEAIPISILKSTNTVITMYMAKYNDASGYSSIIGLTISLQPSSVIIWKKVKNAVSRSAK